jgi:hypothetical protein
MAGAEPVITCCLCGCASTHDVFGAADWRLVSHGSRSGAALACGECAADGGQRNRTWAERERLRRLGAGRYGLSVTAAAR